MIGGRQAPRASFRGCYDQGPPSTPRPYTGLAMTGDFRHPRLPRRPTGSIKVRCASGATQNTEL